MADEVLRQAQDVTLRQAQDVNVGGMPTSTGHAEVCTTNGTMNGVELWGRVLESLKGQMTLATFQATFGGSRAGLFDGGTLDVALVSQSACEWARERLACVVSRTVESVVGPGVSVRFSTAKSAKTSERRETGNAGSQSAAYSGGENDVGGDAEVRDQRRVGWYRVDNVVLDDYLPFMGVRAFAVYSLYCRMSGRDGLSWPGYAYVCKTLGIGRATLAKCNTVLETLGLIEIERGNRERSNRYYLLEPEVLTFEVISKIRERAERAGLDALVGALEVALSGEEGVVPSENYPSSPPELPQFPTGTTLVPGENHPSSPPELEQDIVNKTQEQDTGTRDREKREIARKDAKSMSSVGVSPGTSSELAEPASANAVELSDNELAEWLGELGVGRLLASKLILAYERPRVVAWVEYIVEQDTIKNPAGFLRAKLKGGGWP